MLREYAEAVLEEAMAAFPVGYRPALVWKPFRVTAGMAYYRLKAIGLSISLLNDRERVKDTLLHEYAHLLAFHRHGRKAAGHGPEWQQAMQDLGLPPEVRHRYEVTRNQRRQKVVYRCARCGEEFDRVRKFPRGRVYLHVNCGGRIQFVRRAVVVTESVRTVNDESDVA